MVETPQPSERPVEAAAPQLEVHKKEPTPEEAAAHAKKQAERASKISAETAAINALIAQKARDKKATRDQLTQQTNHSQTQRSNDTITQRSSSSTSTDLTSSESFLTSESYHDLSATQCGIETIMRGTRTDLTEQPSARQMISSRMQLDSRPEVLITPCPQSVASSLSLPSVAPEAEAVQAAFGGPLRAQLMLNASVSMLNDALSGKSTWLFAGHGDVQLAGEAVLGFMDDAAGLQAVSVDSLVATVRPHVVDGNLKLVVLTGCSTHTLASALRERAFVPFVLCWETRLLDDAASVFDTAFARAMASDFAPQRAYDAACLAVVSVTEPGFLDDGARGAVQKYELHEDPQEYSRVHPIFPVTAHSGRMRAHAPLAGRGRLAVGKPRLLAPDETKLHGVPSLPENYLPRAEEATLRAACVGACGSINRANGDSARSEGTQRGTPTARMPAIAGIHGPAGLGKSSLAGWLCREDVVRTAFRDGIFWLEVRHYGLSSALA